MNRVLKWTLALVIVIFFVLHLKENQLTGCPFCDPKILDYQKYYEDELVIVLYTHKPIFPGHSLIIPKRHVERFEMLSELEIVRMGQVIKKVNEAVEKVYGTSSYLLLQKNGKEVGQSVPHVHIHYIPRQAGDDSTIYFLLRMYIANFGSPLKSTEMEEAVETMKAAMY